MIKASRVAERTCPARPNPNPFGKSPNPKIKRLCPSEFSLTSPTVILREI